MKPGAVQISSHLSSRRLVTNSVGVPKSQASAVSGFKFDQNKICVQINMALSFRLLDLRTLTQGPLQSPWRLFLHVSRMFASNSNMKFLLCSRGSPIKNISCVKNLVSWGFFSFFSFSFFLN